MATVDYPFQLPYSLDENGNHFPRLTFTVSRVDGSGASLDLDLYLDSGAERSLLDGWIGTSLGLDLLAGPSIRYVNAMGHGLTATRHPILLRHVELGDFELEVGFSSAPIHRNLLGRDFFNLVQIGFRERRLELLIEPTP